MRRSRLRERPGPIRKKGGSKRYPKSKTHRKPTGYIKKVDTPKNQRDHTPPRLAPALVDPMKTLGHPPRPRRGQRSKLRIARDLAFNIPATLALPTLHEIRRW